ncbi:MAG: tripartite tricarboxylate transporter substrate binding protein [Pseudomonadota bacterium]
MAPGFGEALGQTVLIENRAGGGGMIGSTAAAKSPPDGYTLLLGSSGSITLGPAVYKTMRYDPAKDLVPTGAIQAVPLLVTISPKIPINNFKEFLAYSKSKRSPITMATSGVGTTNHLALEMLSHEAKIALTNVPYKGSGAAFANVLGGQVETMMDQVSASLEYVRSGRLKAIAITSLKRSAQLPNVPTLDELGLKGFDATTFTGLFVPAGTPPAVIGKLQAALKKVLTTESVRERYRSLGVEMMDMSPAEFDAFLRADAARWRKVARDANIVLN